MFRFIKRFKELLTIALLVLLPLGAFLTYSQTGRALNPIDRVILAISLPLQRLITTVVGTVSDQWQGLASRHVLHEENRELRKTVALLESRVGEAGELRAENERLRTALDYAPHAPAPLIVARVIGDGPTLNLITLKIDKGTDDGISKGMPVVSSNGLLGRILTVSPSSADVLLLSDSNFSVPVRSERSRARALVSGQGARAMPVLSHASRTDDFEEGDTLITTGTDGLFPPGLIVGRLIGLDRPSMGIFQTSQVTPAVDVGRLEEVLVLKTPAPETTEAPTPSAPKRPIGKGSTKP